MVWTIRAQVEQLTRSPAANPAAMTSPAAAAASSGRRSAAAAEQSCGPTTSMQHNPRHLARLASRKTSFRRQAVVEQAFGPTSSPRGPGARTDGRSRTLSKENTFSTVPPFFSEGSVPFGSYSALSSEEERATSSFVSEEQDFQIVFSGPQDVEALQDEISKDLVEFSKIMSGPLASLDQRFDFSGMESPRQSMDSARPSSQASIECPTAKIDAAAVAATIMKRNSVSEAVPLAGSGLQTPQSNNCSLSFGGKQWTTARTVLKSSGAFRSASSQSTASASSEDMVSLRGIVLDSRRPSKGLLDSAPWSLDSRRPSKGPSDSGPWSLDSRRPSKGPSDIGPWSFSSERTDSSGRWTDSRRPSKVLTDSGRWSENSVRWSDSRRPSKVLMDSGRWSDNSVRSSDRETEVSFPGQLEEATRNSSDSVLSPAGAMWPASSLEFPTPRHSGRDSKGCRSKSKEEVDRELQAVLSEYEEVFPALGSCAQEDDPNPMQKLPACEQAMTQARQRREAEFKLDRLTNWTGGALEPRVEDADKKKAGERRASYTEHMTSTVSRVRDKLLTVRNQFLKCSADQTAVEDAREQYARESLALELL